MKDHKQAVLDLTSVLTFCNAWHSVIINAENNPMVNTRLLKKRINDLTLEADKQIDRWTKEAKWDEKEMKELKLMMNDNLTTFYNLFEMVMNLDREHIGEVTAHIIDNYYNTEEYESKRQFINF